MQNGLTRTEQVLRYSFRHRPLLQRALTHASASAQPLADNERLEFLGDAVLDLVISMHLFEAAPHASEGELTRMRALLVSRQALARVGRAVGLQHHIRTDEGLQQRPPFPGSIIAGAYEAVVAAVYLDGGMEAARQFVLRSMGAEIKAVQGKEVGGDPKSHLQELVQSAGLPVPTYDIVSAGGPAHERTFVAEVRIDGEALGRGQGPSKKAAEQQAARQGLKAWDERTGE